MLENWKDMTPNRKGTIAEAIAVPWLLLQGYEVYKNVSVWGKVDLIILKDGHATFVDVAFCQDGNDPKLSHSREGLDIDYLYVAEDGSCHWRHDVMKTEKRLCTGCKKEFEVKEKSSRKWCGKCRRIPI